MKYREFLGICLALNPAAATEDTAAAIITKQKFMQAQALQNFNQLVALFLSENIRSRRTSLSRAAEISQRVLSSLPGLRSENETLTMLTELEKEFDEVSMLKQALHFGHQASDVKVYEAEIKDYASKIFTHDIQLSAAFLQEAARPGKTIQELCLQYPSFEDYLLKNSEKSELVKSLKRAG